MKRNLNTVIKQYIYDEIRRRPAEAVKIASERELCALFQTSRTTVRKALGELASEGTLIICHGSGVYSNPGRRNFSAGMEIPAIGVVLYHGNSLCFDVYYWAIVNAAQQQLATEKGLTLPLLQLSGDSPERAAAEILKLRLDALIWLHPSVERYDTIRLLDRGNLPVICVGRAPDDCRNSVMYDYPDAGRAVARYFLDNGIKTPVFLADGQEKEYADMTQSFCEAMAAANRTPDFRRLLLDTGRIEEAVERLRREELAVDGVFAFGRFFWQFAESYRRVFGEEAFAALPVVTNKSIHCPGPRRAYLDFDAAMLGKSAAEIIKRRFQGEIEPLRLKLAATVKRD